MAKKLKTRGYSKPIKGVFVGTFVHGYKEENSQMHVDRINGANLSSKGARTMRNIYKEVREETPPKRKIRAQIAKNKVIGLEKQASEKLTNPVASKEEK